MMRAYAELYLPRAMKNLGEAFDYALTACRLGVVEFQSRFAASPEASEWENGSPRVLSGLSGTELVQRIFRELENFPDPQRGDSLSREYWSGWALAYYQWFSARRFAEIFAYVPLEEILEMYAPLHEEAEDRFVERMDSLIAARTSGSPLRRYRELRGLTQAELANRSEVNLRNIRHYEQQAKSIAKAELSTVVALARALRVQVEQLAENIP